MEIEYTDKVDLRWAAEAAETFRIEALPSAADPVLLELEGECPRCRHAMQLTKPLITFRGVAATDADTLREALDTMRREGAVGNKPLLPVEFTVQCRCPVKHPDRLRRAKLTGCGAIWKMRVEPFAGKSR